MRKYLIALGLAGAVTTAYLVGSWVGQSAREVAPLLNPSWEAPDRTPVDPDRAELLRRRDAANWAGNRDEVDRLSKLLDQAGLSGPDLVAEHIAYLERQREKAVRDGDSGKVALLEAEITRQRVILRKARGKSRP